MTDKETPSWTSQLAKVCLRVWKTTWWRRSVMWSLKPQFFIALEKVFGDFLGNTEWSGEVFFFWVKRCWTVSLIGMFLFLLFLVLTMFKNCAEKFICENFRLKISVFLKPVQRANRVMSCHSCVSSRTDKQESSSFASSWLRNRSRLLSNLGFAVFKPGTEQLICPHS